MTKKQTNVSQSAPFTSFPGMPLRAGAPLSRPVPIPTQIGFKLSADDVSLLQTGIAPGESIHMAARRILLTALATPDLWFLAWFLEERNIVNGKPRLGSTSNYRACYRFVIIESSSNRMLGFLQKQEDDGHWYFFSPSKQSEMTWKIGGVFTFDHMTAWRITGFPQTGHPDAPVVMCELERVLPQ